jgi:hypothetical protein
MESRICHLEMKTAGLRGKSPAPTVSHHPNSQVDRNAEVLVEIRYLGANTSTGEADILLDHGYAYMAIINSYRSMLFLISPSAPRRCTQARGNPDLFHVFS